MPLSTPDYQGYLNRYDQILLSSSADKTNALWDLRINKRVMLL